MKKQNNIVDGSVNFTPLPTEITSLEDPAYKASKLSAEEKKEKIHRYLKKRNERNFSKKIKVSSMFTWHKFIFSQYFLL